MRGSLVRAQSREHIFEAVHPTMVHKCESTLLGWKHTSNMSMLRRMRRRILHILRCPSRKEVHLEYNKTFEQIMRDIEAPNNLLHLFVVGIDLALLDGDTHSSEEWNSNPNGSTMDWTISELLYDDMIPQQYKMASQQQTMVGWEHLFMGKMVSGWKHCWPDKKYWGSSIEKIL